MPRRFASPVLRLARLSTTPLANRRLGFLVTVAVAALCVPSLGGQSPSAAPSLVQVTDTTAGQAPVVDFPTFVSQDGSLVAFVVHHGLSDDFYSDVGLYIGSTDGTSPPWRITPPGLNVRSFFGIVPPSFGSKVAFFGCQDASCETSNSGIPGDVYVVGADGTELPTRLTFDAPIAGSFSPIWYEDVIVSGDGTTVAFTQQVPSPTNPNPIKVEHLYLIDSDGTTNRREIVLPSTAFTGVIEWFQPLSFSADGTELAFLYRDFISSSEGVVYLAAIRTDGTGFRKLMDPFAPEGTWALSGDWTTLAFANATGLSIQQLGAPSGLPVAPVAGAYPTISYDGGRICYSGMVAYQTVDVLCVNSDGSDLTNVSNIQAGFQADYPALSSDGSLVAFLSAADLVAGRNSDNSREVFVARLGAPPPPPDTDGDGVPDAGDHCPGTPPGSQVDAVGCPIPPPDSDGDGVPDITDLCPGTRPGVAVDQNGCGVRLHYFALGDSVASGHGLNDDRAACKESPFAYPKLVTSLLSSRFESVAPTYLACSGATVLQPTNPSDQRKWFANQVSSVLATLPSLGSDPVLVSITIGADDLGWSEPWRFFDLLYRLKDKPFINRIDATAGLVATELHRQVYSLLQYPSVAVIVTEYHNPLNTDSVFFLSPGDLLAGIDSLGLCGLQPCYTRSELAVESLNGAAGQAYVGLGRPTRMQLTPVNSLFQGHEAPMPICGGASPSIATTWVQYPSDPESNAWVFKNQVLGGDCFHPNREGARKYADQIAADVIRLGRWW